MHKGKQGDSGLLLHLKRQQQLTADLVSLHVLHRLCQSVGPGPCCMPSLLSCAACQPPVAAACLCDAAPLLLQHELCTVLLNSDDWLQ